MTRFLRLLKRARRKKREVLPFILELLKARYSRSPDQFYLLINYYPVLRRIIRGHSTRDDLREIHDYIRKNYKHLKQIVPVCVDNETAA